MFGKSSSLMWYEVFLPVFKGDGVWFFSDSCVFFEAIVDIITHNSSSAAHQIKSDAESFYLMFPTLGKNTLQCHKLQEMTHKQKNGLNR